MRKKVTTRYYIEEKDISEGKDLLNKDEIEVTFKPCDGTIHLEKMDDGYKIKYLVIDENPLDPRDEIEHTGTMICFHRRYILGDAHSYSVKDFVSWDDLESIIEENENDKIVSLPLYLFDHSGISMRTTKSEFIYCDPFGWDWNQVGLIFISKSDIKTKFAVEKITDEVRENVLNTLRSEVEEYNSYLTGDTYGIVVENLNNEFELIDFDSCFGFYGYKEAKEILKEY